MGRRATGLIPVATLAKKDSPIPQEIPMNGFIKRSAAVLCLGAGLLTLIGCHAYRNVVDPCWPERYNYEARASVRDMHNVQAYKGHILNQTVWSDDFEGDKLTQGAKAKLQYIAHREPMAAVMKVFLQTANVEDPAMRDNLNGQRRKAVLAYLETQRAPGQNTLYEVDVHTYVQPTFLSEWSLKSLMNVEKNFQSGQPQVFVSPTVGGGSGGGAGGR
jgi:hypothetical protein